MSNSKSTTDTKHAAGMFPAAFLPNVEWLKPLSETPTKFYGELLGFAANRLRAQADFVQGLASCGSAPDLFNYHAKFIQESWQSYSEEAQRALRSIQETATPPRSSK